MAGNEVEAAYFTLLRAREEVAALQRYEEYLVAEAQRLRRTTSEAAALLTQVDPGLVRPLRHTDRPLEEVVRARLGAIDDELQRLPDRIAAAEAYVEDCEREHARLRAGG